MIVAHFPRQRRDRETCEVPDTWLQEAWPNRYNVLLNDGKPRIQDLHYTAEGHRLVDMVAPRFARSS
jgi:hypothetical protein